MDMKEELAQELALRELEYKKTVRDFWLKDMSVFGAIGLVVVFGMTWALMHYTGWLKANPGSMEWMIHAGLLWAVMMIPPIKTLYPERPTMTHIHHDRVLNTIGEIVNERRG